MNNWKDKLINMDSQPLENLDKTLLKSTQVKAKDIGMVNPTSGAGFLARDNGKLEGFADYGLGFRFDKDTQSLSIYAPTIKLFTNKKEEHSYEKNISFLKGEYQDVMDLVKKGE